MRLVDVKITKTFLVSGWITGCLVTTRFFIDHRQHKTELKGVIKNLFFKREFTLSAQFLDSNFSRIDLEVGAEKWFWQQTIDSVFVNEIHHELDVADPFIWSSTPEVDMPTIPIGDQSRQFVPGSGLKSQPTLFDISDLFFLNSLELKAQFASSSEVEYLPRKILIPGDFGLVNYTEKNGRIALEFQSKKNRKSKKNNPVYIELIYLDGGLNQIVYRRGLIFLKVSAAPQVTKS